MWIKCKTGEQRRNWEIDYIVKLNDIPIWFFLLVVLAAIGISVLTKKWTIGFLVGYVLIILGETVLFRTSYYGEHFQPHIFWSYKVWDVQKRQVIANILMFIPLGLVAGNLWKWKGILAGLVVSVSVELLQLLTERGLYEFDDILHNTLGTTIGVSIFILVETAVKKKGNNNGHKK